MAALRGGGTTAPPPPSPPTPAGNAATPPPPPNSGSGGAVGGVLASGSYTLNNRDYTVSVPSGGFGTAFPVLLLLHGNGGDGAGILHEWSNKPSVASVRASHILVAPDGPERSWNIVAEGSTLDDAAYVGTTLLDHLASYSNVQPNSFKMYGASNGAALVNRILIENDGGRIVAAVTDGSQLNTHQYRNGAFYVGGASNSYTTVKATLMPRALLQVTGGEDRVIPAAGGASVISDGAGGTLQFVEWQQSAHAFALAYGYAGGMATLAEDDSTHARVTYLNGQVEAYNYKQRGHVIAMSDANVGAVVAAFLTRASPPPAGSSPTGSPPTASGSSPPPPPPPSPPAPTVLPPPPPTPVLAPPLPRRPPGAVCHLPAALGASKCRCAYEWPEDGSSPVARLLCLEGGIAAAASRGRVHG